MKPSNVMLKYDGSVVLIDFGTAREYKERASGDTACLGTQGYAAPEQFGGQGQTDAICRMNTLIVHKRCKCMHEKCIYKIKITFL